eukprot:6878321-Alexandrium_andersonii.AAC.1
MAAVGHQVCARTHENSHSMNTNECRGSMRCDSCRCHAWPRSRGSQPSSPPWWPWSQSRTAPKSSRSPPTS